VENAVTVIGLDDLKNKIMLLLNHVVAGKIMILRIVLRKILCRAVRKKQRDLRNHGNSKTEKAVMLKKDLKEIENNTGQTTLLDIYYIVR